MLVIVAQPGNPVFAPPICAASCLIVTQIIPRGTCCAVIFAHSSPLALAQIGAPAPPRRSADRLFKSLSFFHETLPGLLIVRQRSSLQRTALAESLNQVFAHPQ